MIENFFQELFAAYEQQKAYHDERVRNGEYFNVFNVLGLNSNETRTHSAFIAELLNPYGSHGMGDLFLKKFLPYTHIEDLQLDTKNAFVEVERYIGEIDDDYEHGGRIDIIVESKDGKGIIIENKIYAVDQRKQLVRYYNYAESTYSDYRLLYISLDKEEASPLSTEGNNKNLVAGKDYLSVTYRKEILKWLNDCLEELSNNTVVYVIIKQYTDLLKQLTYQMKENNIVLDVLKKEENWACTLEVLKNVDSWKESVWQTFFEEFRKQTEHLDWLIESNGVFDVCVQKHKDADCSVHVTYESSGAYIGINVNDNESTPQQCLYGLEKPNNWWPYGWKWLEKGYRNIRPDYDLDSMKYFFLKDRQDLIDYLIQEVTTIINEAEKAGIKI